MTIYTLKSCRPDSNSMLTMFTHAPQPAGANAYLWLKYGYSSGAYDNGENALHSTLPADRFTPIADSGHILKIWCNIDGIYIMPEDGKIYMDLRIGQYHNGPNKGKTHDYGTGFRTKETISRGCLKSTEESCNGVMICQKQHISKNVKS